MKDPPDCSRISCLKNWWCLETDLAILIDWFKANKLTLNVNETVYMLFRDKENLVTDHIVIDNEKIPVNNSTKFLGLWMGNNLNWKRHTSILINKIKRNTTLIRNTKNIFNKDTLKLIYYTHIHSHITYGLNMWGGMVTKEVMNKIQKVQNSCLSMIQQKQKIALTAKKEKILNISSPVWLEHLKLGCYITLFPQK